ncbi:MAG: hypothetical protein GKS01_03880 [Alphaproteobacteria bacterium]|nr:hypothetical protein [Alphaproteobacteria bacterium]
MFDQPSGAYGLLREHAPASKEPCALSLASSIDLERTIWDPDYRRWAIDQLSKQEHG